MFAAAVTLGLFGFVLVMVVDVMRRDGRKIIAALEGRSWVADPTYDRPMTIRFSQRNRVAAPASQPALRAAA